MNIPQFIYQFTWGHLYCFQSVLIMRKSYANSVFRVCVNMSFILKSIEQICSYGNCMIMLDCTPILWLALYCIITLDCMVILWLDLWNAKLFSKVPVLFCFLANSEWEFLLFCIFNSDFASCLEFGHSNRCNRMPLMF